MALELTTNGLLGLLATFVQLAVALVLFGTSSKSAVNRLLGFLFLLNGLIAFYRTIPQIWPNNEALFSAGLTTAHSVDFVTNILIGYLVLLYPNRSKLATRYPWVLFSFVIALSLLFWFPVVFFDGFSPFNRGANTTWVFAHEMFSVTLAGVVFPFLMVRWSRAFETINNPAQLLTFKFVFAAFGMRAIHQIVTWSTRGSIPMFSEAYWSAPNFEGIVTITSDLLVITASIFAVVYTTIVLAKMGRTRDAEHLNVTNFVSIFLIGGLALAIIDLLLLIPTGSSHKLLPLQPITNVDTWIVRPILIWAALVQHHLSQNGFLSKLKGPVMAPVIATPVVFGIALSLVLPNGIISWPGLLMALLITVAVAYVSLIATRAVFNKFGAESLGIGAREADYLAAVDDFYRRGGQLGTDRSDLTKIREDLELSDARAVELESLMQEFLVKNSSRSKWENGDTVLGRYLIEDKLGEGGMGMAYLCHDKLSAQQVVLKRQKNLEPNTLAAIKREAAVLEKIRHPNILQLLRTVSFGTEVVLITEVASGGTLEKALGGPVNRQPNLRVMLHELLGGIDAAHQQGVVHRDIKPSNILLSKSGSPIIADFGIAQDTNFSDTLIEATVPSSKLVGSIRYMAPEQWQNGHVSRRSDLYAIGTILIDCALMHGPKDSVPNLRVPLSASEREAGISLLPSDCRNVVKKLTEGNPGSRPPSARHALKMLARASTGPKNQQRATNANNVS